MSETELSTNKVAELLLQIKAIQLQPQNPFTFASGLLYPIYCDNRMILSYPAIRNYIIEQFAGRIREDFSPVAKITNIAGVATSGIALGALAAHAFDLPFV